MAAKRHVIVGGGTAGLNAMTTIREYDKGESEVVLVSREWPYSRMVLPYYLGHTISESHVFTATAPRLANLGIQFAKADAAPAPPSPLGPPPEENSGDLIDQFIPRRAASLDTANNQLTLEDGVTIGYDDLLIATGSTATRPPDTRRRRRQHLQPVDAGRHPGRSLPYQGGHGRGDGGRRLHQLHHP